MKLILGLALSAHLGLSNDYNSVHPQVYAQHEDIYVGAYYNSDYKVSGFAATRLEFEHFDIDVGLATGYNNSITPIARIKKGMFFAAPIQSGGDKGLLIGIEFNGTIFE